MLLVKGWAMEQPPAKLALRVAAVWERVQAESSDRGLDPECGFGLDLEFEQSLCPQKNQIHCLMVSLEHHYLLLFWLEQPHRIQSLPREVRSTDKPHTEI